MGRFDDKVAVVTGGTTGIGLATARRFAEEGARVVVTGRDEAALAAAGEAIPGAVAVRADQARIADAERLAAEVRARFDRVDVLFVNAGVARFAPFAETDEATFDANLDVNLKGAFFTIQKLLPLLGRGASIVLTGSVAASKGMPGTAAYAASKAALRSLARTLSAELIDRGIRVNVVSPGPIDTPIFAKSGAPDDVIRETKARLASTVPLKRLGTSEEVADAVLFLASAESSFIVGAEIAVDGGVGQL